MATLSSILDEVRVVDNKQSTERVSSPNASVVWLEECAYERVVVYQDRAEVIRAVEAAVREGENEITLVGLPQVTDRDSIRVEVASAQVTISDVVYIEQLEVAARETGGEESQTRIGGTATAAGETEDLRAAVKGLRGEENLLMKRIEVVSRTQKILEKFGCMLDKGRTSDLKKQGEQPVRALSPSVTDLALYLCSLLGASSEGVDGRRQTQCCSRIHRDLPQQAEHVQDKDSRVQQTAVCTQREAHSARAQPGEAGGSSDYQVGQVHHHIPEGS